MPSQNSDPRKDASGTARAVAVAWTLPFELIAPPIMAGGIGYLLDRWWHTKPIFMLVLGLGGMVLGIVNAIKTASLLDKKSGN
jgi:F0F1-type ATP synthase assembly protein I